MNYAHLSQEERYQIRWLRKGGWSLEYIATELHRAPSTISRELRRNATIEGGYDNRYAQRPAMQRRHVATALPRIDAQTWVTVEARLRKDWSPEQIAGTDEVAISTERIYQHSLPTGNAAALCGSTCAGASTPAPPLRHAP